MRSPLLVGHVHILMSRRFRDREATTSQCKGSKIERILSDVCIHGNIQADYELSCLKVGIDARSPITLLHVRITTIIVHAIRSAIHRSHVQELRHVNITLHSHPQHMRLQHASRTLSQQRYWPRHSASLTQSTLGPASSDPGESGDPPLLG